jgi:GTP-binding protein
MVNRAMKALRRADVVLLVLDATQGMSFFVIFQRLHVISCRRFRLQELLNRTSNWPRLSMKKVCVHACTATINIMDVACMSGRACVILLNKWDAVPDKDDKTYIAAEKNLRDRLTALQWAQVNCNLFGFNLQL